MTHASEQQLKSSRRIILFVVGALVAAVLVAGYWMLESRSRSENILDELTFLVFGEDTEFAPGYSETSFRRVTPGMSRDEVQALLGAPLPALTTPADSTMRYSFSPSSTHYRERTIYLENGRVRKTVANLFFD